MSAVATAWGLHPGSISLVGQRGILAAAVAATAAFGVFCGLQVTGFDSFLRFFLCHFIPLSRWFGPSVNSRLENSFLAVH
jgi:hypothetical protein